MKNVNAGFLKSKIVELWNHPAVKNFFRSLLYAFHVIFHPFDGFWDLKHEKRGSLAAANVIVAITLLSRLWTKQFTSFLFISVNWETVNIWAEMAMIFVPLLIWCVSNWCLTTLFDGLGSFKDVYITTAYALTPYPLIQIPLCIVSNFINLEEGALYTFFGTVSLVWCVALLLVGLMETHDYTMGKTILSVLVSILGMLVIIILCLLIFSMTSEAIAYFISFFKEFIIRFT